MNRLSVSLLVAGLAFTGTAVAQSSDYYGQEDRYSGSDPYPSDSYRGQEATYDYARVLRVDPVIGSGNGYRTSQQPSRCYYRQADDVYTGSDGYYNQNEGYQNDSYQNDRYDRDDGHYGRDDGYRSGNEASRTVATVIGGIAGAVLGSKIGDGSGRYVGTAVGSMVGGMAGRSIYDSSQRNRQYERRGTVRVCDPVPVTGRDGYYGDDYGDDESLNGYDVTYEYANRTYHTRTNYHPGDRIRVRVDVQAE